MEKTTKKEGFLKRLMRPSDLTTGKPWLVLFKYAAPIILSQLLQQIYVCFCSSRSAVRADSA